MRSIARTFIIVTLFFTACQSNEFKNTKATIDQKLFLNHKDFCIDQADRIVKGGFTFVQVTQTPSQKPDSAFLKPIDMPWHFFLDFFKATDLSKDSANQFKYTVLSTEDLPNAKVTLDYQPNASNLPVSKYNLILDANDNEVKTVNIEWNKNSIFESKLYKVTYVPGKVLQAYINTNPLIGKTTEQIKSIYLFGGDMHKADVVNIELN